MKSHKPVASDALFQVRQPLQSHFQLSTTSEGSHQPEPVVLRTVSEGSHQPTNTTHNEPVETLALIKMLVQVYCVFYWLIGENFHSVVHGVSNPFNLKTRFLSFRLPHKIAIQSLSTS